MSGRTILIGTPSRLHFGMLSFGQHGQRQFGGVGAMINQPGVHLSVTPAEKFNVTGPLADRTRAFAARVVERLGLAHPPACEVAFYGTATEHVGLGLGTQLGLAVADGISRFVDQAQPDLASLVKLAGRGERSAIGAYGYAQGGLLVEAGKLGDELSPLVERVDLPETWRFLLITPRNEQGISGADERAAFAALPPIPPQTTAALTKEAMQGLLPAAKQGDFESFSESLYRYGRMAGECFATRQAGAYATERLAQLVDMLRSLSVRGVGQSSWGPTLFALMPSVTDAEELQHYLFMRAEGTTYHYCIAEPNNHGARVQEA